MQQSSNLEIPLRVIGPDGTTVVWQGSGIMGIPRVIKNTEASSTITEAMNVILDPAASILPASNLAATATPVAIVLAGKIGAANGANLGFATANIVAGAQGVLWGIGSICNALVAGATGTLNHHALPGAAGVVTSSASVGANPVQAAGFVVKPSGTTGGATDTGVATRMGVLVMPHAAVT
jgi:hypothetical protein